MDDDVEGAAIIDQHPIPEQIVAYHERRLPPAEAEAIRAHLVDCADCTAELLALADLYDDADGSAAEVSRPELDAAWQRQRERLFPAAPVVPLERRQEVRPPRRDWRTAAPFAIAASLLAVVTVVQWRTIVRLEAPRVNPPLVDLEPVDSKRNGRSAVAMSLPGEADRVWMILNPALEEIAGDARYDVEIQAPGGRVRRIGDLAISEAGNLRLEVPRSALTVGEHRILLFENREGRRELVEEFQLSIAAP